MLWTSFNLPISRLSNFSNFFWEETWASFVVSIFFNSSRNAWTSWNFKSLMIFSILSFLVLFWYSALSASFKKENISSFVRSFKIFLISLFSLFKTSRFSNDEFISSNGMLSIILLMRAFSSLSENSWLLSNKMNSSSLLTHMLSFDINFFSCFISWGVLFLLISHCLKNAEKSGLPFLPSSYHNLKTSSGILRFFLIDFKGLPFFINCMTWWRRYSVDLPMSMLCILTSVLRMLLSSSMFLTNSSSETSIYSIFSDFLSLKVSISVISGIWFATSKASPGDSTISSAVIFSSVSFEAFSSLASSMTASSLANSSISSSIEPISVKDSSWIASSTRSLSKTDSSGINFSL